MKNPHWSGGDGTISEEWELRSPGMTDKAFATKRRNILLNNPLENVYSNLDEELIKDFCATQANKKDFIEKIIGKIENEYDTSLAYIKNRIKYMKTLLNQTNEPTPTTGVSTSSASLPSTTTALWSFAGSIIGEKKTLPFKQGDTFTVVNDATYPGWLYVINKEDKEDNDGIIRIIPQNYTDYPSSLTSVGGS